MEEEHGLSTRLKDNRDKLPPKVTRFTLNQIFEHFSEALKAIRAQLDIADELVEKDRSTEAEYIWRSQVVFLASALDFYMHELTKLGLDEIYNNKWDKPKQYDKIKIRLSIGFLEKALKGGGEADCFRECINDHFKEVPMISTEVIATQFKLLGIDYKEVACKAFPKEGSKEKAAEALKCHLEELFRRRNMIAHQTDRTHSDAQLQGISREIAMKFVEDVEEIVKAINAEAENK